MVNPASLRGFEKALHVYIRADDEHAAIEHECIVRRAGVDPETFASASELAAIRNPKGNPIIEIQLVARGVDRNVVLSFDCYGRDRRAAISFAARAASPLTLSKLEEALLSEATHIRAWYSPIRAFIDGLLYQSTRIPTWLWTVFWVFWIVAMISLVAASFSRSSALREWHDSTSTVLEQAREFTDSAASPASDEVSDDLNALHAKTEELDELVERSQSMHPVRQTLFNMALGLLGGIALRWLFALFPRLVFAIGEGTKRHDQLMWLRRFVLGSIIVTGGVLPLIRAGFRL